MGEGPKINRRNGCGLYSNNTRNVVKTRGSRKAIPCENTLFSWEIGFKIDFLDLRAKSKAALGQPGMATNPKV
jgi:hypothetical protein